MSEQITARLENWHFSERFGCVIAWGFCYDDSLQRFRDGDSIHTSAIVDFQQEEMKKGALVKTLSGNTYLLGERLLPISGYDCESSL